MSPAMVALATLGSCCADCALRKGLFQVRPGVKLLAGEDASYPACFFEISIEPGCSPPGKDFGGFSAPGGHGQKRDVAVSGRERRV